MPANRRRSAITAPYDRWVLLGSRLELRRRTLGYTWRPDFERERGVNKRLAADIEKAARDRVGKFMPGTLQLVAQGYAVAYESVLALLRGETDDLVPVPVALAPGPPDLSSPFADPGRTDLNRPWFDPVNERRVRLAAKGITDPDGEQIFPDAPDDAKAWDNIGDSIPVGDKVWILADLRRRAAGRAGDSGTGTDGA
jgi:hypothetical protein